MAEVRLVAIDAEQVERSIFYCVECGSTEDRPSDEGWDCARCSDPMERFVPVPVTAYEEGTRELAIQTVADAYYGGRPDKLDAAASVIRDLLAAFTQEPNQ